MENILNLMSLILPYATVCICIKISSHFYVLGFRPSIIATIVIIQMLWFASMLSAQILLVVFLVMCNFTHPVSIKSCLSALPVIWKLLFST